MATTQAFVPDTHSDEGVSPMQNQGRECGIPAHENETEAAEEMKLCLNRMSKLSAAFYSRAVCMGNHAFIEFTGLINEYIKACETAAARGQDFRNASKHSEQGPVKLEDFQIAYIREKLGCIFGNQLFSVPAPRGRSRE